jgi:hypothetical protein
MSPLHAQQSYSKVNPVLSVNSCTCNDSGVWYAISVGSKALMVLAGVFLATMTKDVPVCLPPILVVVIIFKPSLCDIGCIQ